MQKFVTVDTSVIVSALVETEPRHAEALDIWGKVCDSTFFAILPLSVLVEVVSAINRRTGDKAHALRVMQFILNLESIYFVGLNSDRSEKSCDITIETKTRGMDSIVIQIAKEFGTELITFDNAMMAGYNSLKA